MATDGALMGTDEKELNRITESIIGLAYKLANKMGSGFAEKCYENALACELRKAGRRVEQQFPLKVWYEGIVVVEFFADLLVDGLVIIELKAIQAFDSAHAAQCINYLAATKLPIRLLVNFGRRVTIKRIVGPAFADIQSSSMRISAPSVANDYSSVADHE